MDDRARVAQQLGREPQGAFDVVVRDADGEPLVIRNAPFLDDGTPMPTRYYLVGPELVAQVSRLEADGGVRRAEAELDADAIAATHERYAAERDAAIPADHGGPRPSGGVGGTRTGVKCLHAHVAHRLAGGVDPVGDWTLARIDRPPATPAKATEPDEMTVCVEDRSVDLLVEGGTEFRLPIGPLALLDGPMQRDDPPAPEQLTNALGFVQDHLDDVIIAAPSIAATPSVVAVGHHAVALAQVEIGSSTVPERYRLARADADEVFRTLATEPIVDRRHNPGLPEAHVESIVATCCVILGIMRRLGLDAITISAGAP